jgi:hypothetical protein
MEMQPLVDQLPALRKEVEDWRKREEEARAKRQGLQQVIRGIEQLAGVERPPSPNETTDLFGGRREATEKAGQKKIRGTNAVRRVISTDPDRAWRVGEVHGELVKNGWVSENAQFPERGTEAAINRLWRQTELERVAKGRYKATPKMKEVPPED